MPRITKADAERFWGKVDKTPGHGPHGDCWLWAAGHTGTYGMFWFGGRCLGAHRVAFRLAGGQQKRGLIVMHTCDTPLCCNPAHLRLGTQSDNMRDAYAKGRKRQPTRAVPLTEAELLQIKHEFDHGLSKNTLSKKWQVDRTSMIRLLDRLASSPVASPAVGNADVVTEASRSA
jgi:hypothetical protein